MNQPPGIGRIVHYVTGCTASEGSGVHVPAIVVRTTEMGTYLTAFGHHGSKCVGPSEEDPEGRKPNSWHWPERD